MEALLSYPDFISSSYLPVTLETKTKAASRTLLIYLGLSA